MQLERNCTKCNRITQCLQRLRLINRREVIASNRVAPTNLKLVLRSLPHAGSPNFARSSLHPLSRAWFTSKPVDPDDHYPHDHCRSLLSVEIYQ
jgi:hypothetical protein